MVGFGFNNVVSSQKIICEGMIFMRKIEISNQLADQLNFKNLRGLKMSISRTFGKGTIQDNQVEVDRAIKSC